MNILLNPNPLRCIKNPSFLLKLCNHLHIPSRPTTEEVEIRSTMLKMEDKILSSCDNGDLSSAVMYMERCASKEIPVRENTYVALLDQCGKKRALEHGLRIHRCLTRMYLRLRVFAANNLMNMYIRCGCLDYARQVFDQMPVKNTHSWNHMLAGYTNLGTLEEAEKFFHEMNDRDSVSWSTMLGALARNDRHMQALEFFRRMHCRGVKIGHQTFFCSILTVCAVVGTARPVQQVHALARNDRHMQALEFFRRMHCRGVKIGHQTFFCSILTVCAVVGTARPVQQVHALALKNGFLEHPSVACPLLNAYGKIGLVDCARQVFDKMPERDILAWTTMVSGYALLGKMEDAWQLFDKMPDRNNVSWTAIVSGYAQHGHALKALETLKGMLMAGWVPDRSAFGSLFKAFSSLGCPVAGKMLHGLALQWSLDCNVYAGGALVDMYGKFGMVEDALLAFKEIYQPDTVVWTTLIDVYTCNGRARDGIRVFGEMLRKGIMPNHMTFRVVLSACSHSGMLKEGKEYFASMLQKHNIAPTEEHYVCFVDLLVKAGLLDEVAECIDKMPFKPNVGMWKSILGASQAHENVELAIRAAEAILEVNPQESENYSILYQLYDSVGRNDDVVKVKTLMEERSIVAELGTAKVKMDKADSSITFNNRPQPQSEESTATLTKETKEAECVANINPALQEVEDQKLESLSHHT